LSKNLEIDIQRFTIYYLYSIIEIFLFSGFMEQAQY